MSCQARPSQSIRGHSTDHSARHFAFLQPRCSVEAPALLGLAGIHELGTSVGSRRTKSHILPDRSPARASSRKLFHHGSEQRCDWVKAHRCVAERGKPCPKHLECAAD
eukprot:127788-Pyramimonas_sp.AAC.1